MIVLVALRLSIGWHFYQEGVKKMRDPDFSSSAFLRQAKGPLADVFKSYVPDPDGKARLDLEQTLKRWSDYREKLTVRFGFDAAQKERASEVLKTYSERLRYYLDENQAEIDQYLEELERLEEARDDKSTRDVAYRWAWIEEHQRKQLAKSSGWLADIDAIRRGYQTDLNAVATNVPHASDVSWLEFKTAAKHWDAYSDAMAKHYSFDSGQKQQAAAILKRHTSRLERHYKGVKQPFDKHGVDIENLRKAREELAERQKQFDEQKADPLTAEQEETAKQIVSRKAALDKREGDLQKRFDQWSAILNTRANGLQRDIRALVDKKQFTADYPMPRVNKTSIDKIVTYLTLIVGVCLMLGLCTRMAATTGALFLCSVMLTQWPGAVGAQPIYNQLVETLALLVLVVTAAGRFAGLDYFLGACCAGCCGAGATKPPAAESPAENPTEIPLENLSESPSENPSNSEGNGHESNA